MNFDVNLLSNLMQMFSTQQNVGTQGYSMQNSGAMQNNSASSDMASAKLNNRYTEQNGYAGASGQNDTYRSDNQGQRMSAENNGRVAYQSTSFAMENGIGDNVRFEQPKINRGTQPPPTINPIFSLLQMMQGGSPQTMQSGLSQAMQGGYAPMQSGSPQNGDVMSSMLPLLMNLLKKPSPQPNNTIVNDNGNNNPHNDCNGNNNNTCNCNDNSNSTGNCNDNNNSNNNRDYGGSINNNQQNTTKSTVNTGKKVAEDNDSRYKKTQPSFFKPIAFAGYELMSSLCKLYLTSALRHDR